METALRDMKDGAIHCVESPLAICSLREVFYVVNS